MNWSVDKDVCIFIPDGSNLPASIPTRFESFRDIRKVANSIRGKVQPLDVGMEEVLNLLRQSIDAKYLCYLSIKRFGKLIGSFHIFEDQAAIGPVESIIEAYHIDKDRQYQVYNRCADLIEEKVNRINADSAIRDMNQGEIVRVLIDVEVGGYFYERIARGFDLFGATMIEEHVPEAMSKMRELKNSIRHITR